MRKSFVLLFLFLISISSGEAAEVDSFTNRYQEVEDSMVKIDNKFNQTVAGVLIQLNKYSKTNKKYCNEADLFRALRSQFSNKYFGKFTKWLTKTDSIERIITPLDQSIYKDISIGEAIITGGVAKINDPSASLLKVAGLMIGDDKFEHFFGSGFRYFNTYYIRGNPIEDALKIGQKAENGILGAKTTGVISFADMVANFNGMRFWNHILNKYDDVLGHKYNSVGPYIQCYDKQWKQVKKLTFKTYLDPAFDEGINCSNYSKQSIVDKVNSHISLLEKNDQKGRSYVCPIRPRVIPFLKEKYGRLSETLLNDQLQ